jgi:aspartate carbamoyltransferase catalytic subunit
MTEVAASRAGGQSHLLGIEGMTRSELVRWLERARSFVPLFDAPEKKLPALRGRTVVTVFFEPSTRTRTSFEMAAKRLSAECIHLGVATSSTTKGETFLDTLRTVDAMHADVLVVRHSESGAARFASRHVRGSVVNAGDGANEHPTQALLDALTLVEEWNLSTEVMAAATPDAGGPKERDSLQGGPTPNNSAPNNSAQKDATQHDATQRGAAKGPFAGRTVAIVGDLAHSRVARSNIRALSLLGARVRLAGPCTLLPRELETLGALGAPSVEIVSNLDGAVEGVDAVMMLRVQHERLAGGGYFPSPSEYSRAFGLTAARFRRAKPGAVVLHPGPMNRGIEIAPDVADGVRSRVLRQVRLGVAVRMAVLADLVAAA